MTIEWYKELIAYAQIMCKNNFPNEYHMDVVHNIITRENSCNKSIKHLFLQERDSILANRHQYIPIDVVRGNIIAPSKSLINYKYCYSCDSMFPESEFYTNTNNNALKPQCKTCYNASNIGRDRTTRVKRTVERRGRELKRKKRRELSDYYIIDLIKKENKYNNINEEISPEQIAEKRLILYNKRVAKAKSKYNNRSKAYNKERRDNITDGYIQDVLSKNGISKGEITEEMIINKRNSILQKRMRKLQRNK